MTDLMTLSGFMFSFQPISITNYFTMSKSSIRNNLYSETPLDQLTKHQSKQLQLLHDTLNCFKLDIYNHDTKSVLKNYTNDTFCHQYLVYRKCSAPKNSVQNSSAYSYFSNGKKIKYNQGDTDQQTKPCRLQHTWTLFDLIHDKADSKYDQDLAKALLYIKYLIYYTKDMLLPDVVEPYLINRFKTRLCMLYYHAASALLPNVYLHYNENSKQRYLNGKYNLDLNSIEYYFGQAIEYNDASKYPVLIIYNKYAVFCGYFINDFKKAIIYFDKCTIECRESNNNKWNENGRQWYDYALFCQNILKDYNKAVELFKECIHRSPNSGTNFYEFGLLYYEMGPKYYKESIVQLKKSINIKISKNNNQSYYNHDRRMNAKNKIELPSNKREHAIKLIKKMKSWKGKSDKMVNVNGISKNTLKNNEKKQPPPNSNINSNINRKIDNCNIGNKKVNPWQSHAATRNDKIECQRMGSQLDNINVGAVSKSKQNKNSNNSIRNIEQKRHCVNNKKVNQYQSSLTSKLMCEKKSERHVKTAAWNNNRGQNSFANYNRVQADDNYCIGKPAADFIESNMHNSREFECKNDTIFDEFDITEKEDVWKQEFEIFWNLIECSNNSLYKQYYFQQFVKFKYNLITLLSCINKQRLKNDIKMTDDDCQYFIQYKMWWMKSHLKFLSWLHKLKLFDKYNETFKKYGILTGESLMRKTNNLDTNLLEMLLSDDSGNLKCMEQDIWNMKVNIDTLEK